MIRYRITVDRGYITWVWADSLKAAKQWARNRYGKLNCKIEVQEETNDLWINK
jgi:hypothetical protein